MKPRRITIRELEESGAIKDIQDGNHGANHPVAGDYVDRGIPFLMSKDIKDGFVDMDSCAFLTLERATSLRVGFARAGDVLLTHKGTMGHTAVLRDVDDFAILTPQVTYYRLNDTKLYNEYLMHAFRHPLFQAQLASHSGQSTRPYLSISGQRDLTIHIWDLADQRKIASVLSAYDSLIQNALRRVKILEELAQLAYREWFVEFRFPGHEEVDFVDSRIGRIPSSWELSTVGHASSFVSRGPSLKYTENDGIPVLNQRCIRNGDISLEAIRHAEPLTGRSSDLYLKLNDVLVNSMGVGTLGRVSRNVSIVDKMIIHSCITVVRSDPSKVSQEQLFYCLRDNQPRFESLGVGATGQTSLRPEVIKETPIVLPPASLSRQFSEILQAPWRQVGIAKRRNEVLRNTRDLLLPKFVSGDLDVSELDIEIGDVET